MSGPPFRGFPKGLCGFFDELVDNNNRDWFAENKPRYLRDVVDPGLDFIRAMEKPLKKISPYFVAVPKRSGGSMMRIYRDTRFSKNKTPYKTNLGIHFRHEAGKDVHAPGFYFHVEPDQVMLGAGIWRPESQALNQIRATIDEYQARWKRIKSKKVMRDTFEFTGDTLIRPPRGYDKKYPLLEDLKRKDFCVTATLKRQDLRSPEIVNVVANHFKIAMPLVRFLCDALHLPS